MILSAKTGKVTGLPPEPTAAELLEQARQSATLERAAFARSCAQAGIITWAEATAWAAMQALPSIALGYVNALPEVDQDEATFTLLTSPRVWRLDPNVLALAVDPALDLTDAQVDALFGIS